MYPILANNALIMSIGTLQKPAAAVHKQPTCNTRPMVKAATLLGQNSSTEIIDVSGLSQKSSPLIQYVEVADIDGQLYSVDRHVNTSCWLKIISIAKDCQSCNVLLMTTDKGIILKTIRNITPGEPLLMWFTEHVLAMLNMPYLTNLNIQGQNRYICHICNDHFEHPNPLKIHLALKCNRLDSNYLWMQLAKEFDSTPQPKLCFSLYQKLPPFSLKNSELSRTSPSSASPVFTETVTIRNINIKNGLTNDVSRICSNQTLPISSIQVSPSPTHISYCSSSSLTTQILSVKKNISQRHSAFKPYINQSNSYVTNIPSTHDKPTLIPFHVHKSPDTASMRPDAQAAHMEIIVSNLGKSKQGHLCIYCGKIYSRKYGLKIHIRTHTGYKPLKYGETPYRCDLCGKVLVRRRDLERHIRSRHQDNSDHVSDISSDGMDI
ncbi:PREDICTED: zinc finger protein 672 [Ceratosolen solmsi marchali]|uniref:Zinc finger protein 672 n=1 Tax=Ceratosolen solmsi marchali TaxID=326594 RepID=A0AAJ6YQL2_9HYME|nr:PREDICTED: zinc finger protein 672 [Ceratosolen solmsi marchali]